MDGYKGRDYYTAEEVTTLIDGCLWQGVGIGVVATIIIEAVGVFMWGWSHNWF